MAYKPRAEGQLPSFFDVDGGGGSKRNRGEQSITNLRQLPCCIQETLIKAQNFHKRNFQI